MTDTETPQNPDSAAVVDNTENPTSDGAEVAADKVNNVVESEPKPTSTKRSASPSGERDDAKRNKAEVNGEDSNDVGATPSEAQTATAPKRKASPSDDAPDNKRTKPETAEAGENEAEEKAVEDGEGGEDDGEGENNRPRASRYRPNHQKSTFTSLEESSDPVEIRSQVEFYFSDSNLPTDQYLLKLTGGSENNPVPLKTIHTFKRMQHFQPYSAVRDAVKASEFLNLDDKDEITRKKPLLAKFTTDVQQNKALLTTMSMSRSIYAKGFGDEDKNTHLQIEEFFKPYGPVRSVRLRRREDNAFKGSVFVEFEDEATQARFLALEPKPKWNGEDLNIMSKQTYVDEKHNGIIDGIVKPKRADFRSFRTDKRGRGHGKPNRSRDDDRDRDGGDGVDKDDWNARRDRDNKHDGGDRRGGGHRGRGRGRGGRGRGRGRGRGGGDRHSRNRDDRD